jgi:hypothetical protein
LKRYAQNQYNIIILEMWAQRKGFLLAAYEGLEPGETALPADRVTDTAGCKKTDYKAQTFANGLAVFSAVYPIVNSMAIFALSALTTGTAGGVNLSPGWSRIGQ